MATIVNNPGPNNDSNAAAWVIGLIVIVLIALGAIFLLPRLVNQNQAAQQPTTGTDQNSTVPPVVNNYTTINASSTTNLNGTTTLP